MSFLERTQMILGEDAIIRLSKAHVIVFGVGGVGGYAVEALVRSGIGSLTVVDNDRIETSNLNRQIIALNSTIGQYKVDVAEKRILDINPDCRVTKMRMFYLPETASDFDFSTYDYVVDCIDTVTAKIDIVMRCNEAEVPVISSMGTGNKSDPQKLRIADISKTSVCPLARVMRTELRKRGINHLKCVFSTEEVVRTGERTPGSTAFVPSVAGLMIASEVVRDLIK